MNGKKWWWIFDIILWYCNKTENYKVSLVLHYETNAKNKLPVLSRVLRTTSCEIGLLYYWGECLQPLTRQTFHPKEITDTMQCDSYPLRWEGGNLYLSTTLKLFVIANNFGKRTQKSTAFWPFLYAILNVTPNNNLSSIFARIACISGLLTPTKRNWKQKFPAHKADWCPGSLPFLEWKQSPPTHPMHPLITSFLQGYFQKTSRYSNTSLLFEKELTKFPPPFSSVAGDKGRESGSKGGGGVYGMREKRGWEEGFQGGRNYRRNRNIFLQHGKSTTRRGPQWMGQEPWV